MTGPCRLGWVQRRLAALLQRTLSAVAVRLELWDGSVHYDGPQPAIGSLIVGDPQTLRGLVFDPHMRFGEAYMAGRMGVRGGLGPVVEAISRTSLSPTVRDRLALLVPASN